MGGDSAPASTIAGAVEALKSTRTFEIVLVGDQPRIEKELQAAGRMADDKRFSIHHATQVVEMSDSATDGCAQEGFFDFAGLRPHGRGRR